MVTNASVNISLTRKTYIKRVNVTILFIWLDIWTSNVRTRKNRLHDLVIDIVTVFHCGPMPQEKTNIVPLMLLIYAYEVAFIRIKIMWWLNASQTSFYLWQLCIFLAEGLLCKKNWFTCLNSWAWIRWVKSDV